MPELTIKQRILAGEPGATPRTFVHLGLTGKCPARCLKCNVWKHPPAHPGLSADQWYEIVAQLNELLTDAQVTFSGGEPLLLEGIHDLIKRADDLENLFIVINTSAYFISRESAKKLAQSHARFFGISLDGLAETNDEIKGMPGAFSGIFTAIDLLKENDPEIAIGLGYLLARPTLADAVAFAEKYGRDPRIREIRYQPVFQPLGEPFNRGWRRDHFLWPDTKEVCEVLDRLERLKEAGFSIQNSHERLAQMRRYFSDPEAVRDKPCPAGGRTWVIDDRGIVYFCPFHEPVGDAAKEPLAEILSSKRAKKARAKIATCDIAFCHLSTNGGA